MKKVESPLNSQIEISPLALCLNQDETEAHKKYHFNSNNESFSIFKVENELYAHVLVKAMAYHLYKSLYENMQIDPPLYRKYKPDVASFDYSGEPTCWIECFERDYEKIEFICKHAHVQELVLVEVSENVTPLIEHIKKRVHYKYHNLISVLNFIPETISYIDPQEIVIIRDWFEIHNIV